MMLWFFKGWYVIVVHRVYQGIFGEYLGVFGDNSVFTDRRRKAHRVEHQDLERGDTGFAIVIHLSVSTGRQHRTLQSAQRCRRDQHLTLIQTLMFP